MYIYLIFSKFIASTNDEKSKKQKLNVFRKLIHLLQLLLFEKNKLKKKSSQQLI